jgi:hypothetical protein
VAEPFLSGDEDDGYKIHRDMHGPVCAQGIYASASIRSAEVFRSPELESELQKH